jgi:hypothetical protein
MLMILTWGIAFMIVENFKPFEGLSEAAFLNEVNEVATVLFRTEGVRFDRLRRLPIIPELRIQIVSCRHDDNPTGFDAPFQRREHPLKFTPLHAANYQNTTNDIESLSRVSIADRIALRDGDLR